VTTAKAMSDTATETLEPDSVRVRLAVADDHWAVQQLFTAGLVEGQVRGSDTGADIENLQDAYFSDDGESAFWVADTDSTVIGMIGVQKTGDSAAEIRRLRVLETFRRRGVGTQLMEKALGFCQRHGYLKIILDVRIERSPAISLFGKFGFQLAHTRDIDGKKLLDFYLDLYREPDA